MRKHYTRILKDFFHEKLFYRRVYLGISQEEMAYRLAIAGRTYVDLDHGKTGCSALTLALFLIYNSLMIRLEESLRMFCSESVS